MATVTIRYYTDTNARLEMYNASRLNLTPSNKFFNSLTRRLPVGVSKEVYFVLRYITLRRHSLSRAYKVKIGGKFYYTCQTLRKIFKFRERYPRQLVFEKLKPRVFLLVSINSSGFKYYWRNQYRKIDYWEYWWTPVFTARQLYLMKLLFYLMKPSKSKLDYYFNILSYLLYIDDELGLDYRRVLKKVFGLKNLPMVGHVLSFFDKSKKKDVRNV